jgi:hypothetical protein
MTEVAMPEEFKVKQERFLQLCHIVFKQNKDGKELLDTLKDALVDKAPVADPEKSDNHAFYREGQNSIVRSFGANIEAYEKTMKQNAIATSTANA